MKGKGNEKGVEGKEKKKIFLREVMGERVVAEAEPPHTEKSGAEKSGAEKSGAEKRGEERRREEQRWVRGVKGAGRDDEGEE